MPYWRRLIFFLLFFVFRRFLSLIAYISKNIKPNVLLLVSRVRQLAKLHFRRISDRPALSEDELAAFEELVSSWRLCACSFLSSCINWQRWDNCWIIGSATALIWRATSSNVPDTPGDVSILWSDILLGMFSIKLSVSVLLSVSSVSTATVLIKYWKTNWT